MKRQNLPYVLLVLGLALLGMTACSPLDYFIVTRSSNQVPTPEIKVAGAFDFLSAAKVSAGAIAAIMSTVFMLWAIVVVIAYKPANLSREDKQVIG
jgi:hypothetical protein